jgi:CheY-like chemotaxis protein/HPt (histidine-containing phosphotransfer) domain-containing protein
MRRERTCADDPDMISADDPFLRDLFEEEAIEQLDGIEQLLPRLGDPAALDDLYRYAHTLKGSSAVMNIAPVNVVAAALEDVFSTLRGTPGADVAAVEAPVRAVVGELRFLVSSLLAGIDIGSVADDAEQSLRTLGATLALGGHEAPAPGSAAVARTVACACADLAPLVTALAAAQARTLQLVATLAGENPAAIAELATLEAALPATPSLAASIAPARRGSLVVVDDARTVRELHRAILTAAGYDVRTAADGAEALRLLAEAPADAVVTDLDMPVMDGLELTQSIRSRPELAGAAVLVVTSHGDDATRERLLQAGADGVLPKERVDIDRLVEQVDQLLEIGIAA